MHNWIKPALLTSVFLFSLAGFDASNNLAAQDTKAVENREREKPEKTFESFNAATVNLRLNGNAIVYRSRVFVPAPGVITRTISSKVTVNVTVIVPVTEDVDGIPVTKYQKRPRTVEVPVTRSLGGGEYKVQEIELSDEATFLSLDGKKIDRRKAMSKIGMTELPVMLLPKGMEIPAAWKQVLKADTLILQTTGPLHGQPYHAFFSR